MLARMAVLEAVFGEHDVPMGDDGVVAIVSCDRREATSRIRTCAAMLDALGISTESAGPVMRKDKADCIILDRGDQRRIIQVYTATVGGVSGFTSIAVFGDEVCKWRDSDGAANARDVIASLRPTMSTQRNAVMMLSSSPWLAGDAHSEMFDRGNTEGQRVAHAPTWVANPSIGDCTECAARHGQMCDHEEIRREIARLMTVRDEPDEIEWRREYEAIPMAEEATSMFSDDAIKACAVAA